MNPQIKEKWVEDLESGKFPKGRLQLNNNNETYCCLGVLFEQACEVGEAENLGESKSYTNYIEYRDKDGATATLGLTDTIKEWAELSLDEVNCLVNLNDKNPTFEPVIAYIKENL